MTILDEHQSLTRRPERASSASSRTKPPVRSSGLRPSGAQERNVRRDSRRPAITPLHYRGGAGMRLSRASHKPRQISAGVTIVLALLSGAITLWLGVIGHFSGESAESVLPDRLAVIQVQAGDTLERVAGRVAPDLPTGQVMQRIRELNQLESGSLEAGQTLISPIS